MSHEFVQATTSTRREERDGRLIFDAEIHEGWEIGPVSNGGYLLALVGRTMADVAGRPPLTVTGHYLTAGSPGPAQIVVDPVRTGRRLATIRATLSSNGRDVLTVLGTFGRIGDGDVGAAYRGLQLIDGGPPDLSPFPTADAASRSGQAHVVDSTFVHRVDSRFRHGDDGFAFGRPTGTPEIAGWFAFAGEQPIDEIGLLLAADAFPPPIFNTDLPVAWVPTVELTVHIRGVPAPGPLRVVFRSHYVTDGMLSEDGELWDVNGALVAQSRQLALIPRG